MLRRALVARGKLEEVKEATSDEALLDLAVKWKYILKSSIPSLSQALLSLGGVICFSSLGSK